MRQGSHHHLGSQAGNGSDSLSATTYLSILLFLVNYPLLLKLCVAPFLDSFSLFARSKLGRRKSCFVPLYSIVAISLWLMSSYITMNQPNMLQISLPTMAMPILFVLVVVQVTGDAAVDGLCVDLITTKSNCIYGSLVSHVGSLAGALVTIISLMKISQRPDLFNYAPMYMVRVLAVYIIMVTVMALWNINEKIMSRLEKEQQRQQFSYHQVQHGRTMTNTIGFTLCQVLKNMVKLVSFPRM